jgi:glycosyltransferase involved in cell wall biosynthesis
LLNNKKIISVVAPVFNSEKSIKIFLTKLIKYLKLITKNYEIILVNDKSTDKSEKIIRKFKNKNIILKNLKKNLGQHYALIKGLRITRGNTIITLDSDMQDMPSYIPKLYALHKAKKEIFMVSLKKNIFKNYRYLYSLFFWNLFFFISQKKKYPFPSNYLIFSKTDLKDLLKLKKPFILILDFLFLNKKVKIYRGVKLDRKDKKSSYTFKKVLNLAIKIFFHYNIYYTKS